ncbi:MAG TPA: HAMP domain-containing histidine kinase [Sulfurovum sp.]|nr:HAMP domain-containing histidine kinase [Sulfurovum sp.]
MIDNDPILHTNSIVVTYHLPSTHWHIIIGMKESNIMSDYNQTFQNILLLIIVLTLIATFLGYIILQIIFIKPITSINEQLEVNIRKDALQYKHLECEDNGEIGLLVKNLNARTNALEEAQKREAEEIEKNRKNEKLLLQQSKMAAMGEMMDAVAHQWKQPLNALSMYSELIKSDYKDGSVDQAYVDQFRDDIQTQIDHMVNTLDEFRTFFRPNKENQQFLLSDVVNSVLFLTKDDLLKNRITVTIEQEDPVAIEGSENEFKHLVLNIINNAKDAFNDNDIEKRVIGIRIIQDSKGNRLEIEDNAGGISQEILEDIFKANVTSKEEGKGTGIGLYMSTQIAAKHHATLTVKNQNEGACFTVTFH